MAARLIPPEHDGGIGSFAMGDQHACHGTCSSRSDNCLEPVAGIGRHLDHVINRSSLLLVLVAIISLHVTFHCSGTLCDIGLPTVQQGVWTWTWIPGSMLAPFKPPTAVQKTPVQAIRQRSSKISPTRSVVQLFAWCVITLADQTPARRHSFSLV